MTKTVITLEQVNAYSGAGSDLQDVQEGDNVGRYEVVDISDVNCDHPNWDHNVIQDGETGESVVVRRCEVCGHKQKKPVEEVEFE